MAVVGRAPMSFAAAQILPLGDDDISNTGAHASLCQHCTLLLKRCMHLTNQLLRHDHAKCREENASLLAEVERLRGLVGNATPSSAANGTTNELQQAYATIKHLEQELTTQAAKAEAEKRQAVEAAKVALRASSSGSVADGGASAASSSEEVQRYVVELERVRRAGDTLKASVFRHEKKEAELTRALGEHEARMADYHAYRVEVEAELAQAAKEKKTTTRETATLQARVAQLEDQWQRKLEAEASAKSWDDQLSDARAETARARGVAHGLQTQLDGLREVDQKYKEAVARLKQMEQGVTATADRASSLADATVRCGLLEKEVRSLRGWEARHHEQSQKLAVLEKQAVAQREWEAKYHHLDAAHRHALTKAHASEAILIEHAECASKLEAARRDALRALRSSDIRRTIQEEARVAYAALKPQLGCEFLDHRLPAAQQAQAAVTAAGAAAGPPGTPPPTQGASAGAVVTRLRENTPAARAGLQVRDVVTSAGGEAVSSRSALVKACSRFAPGDLLVLGVWRGSSGGSRSSAPSVQIEVEVGASGHSPEEVRDLRRRMEGRITDEDVQRHFASTAGSF